MTTTTRQFESFLARSALSALFLVRRHKIQKILNGQKMCPFIPRERTTLTRCFEETKRIQRKKERTKNHSPHTRSRPYSRPKTAVPSSREIILRLLFSPSCRTCFSTRGETFLCFFLSSFKREEDDLALLFETLDITIRRPKLISLYESTQLYYITLWLDNALVIDTILIIAARLLLRRRTI